MSGIYEKSLCVCARATVGKSAKLQTCTVDLSGIITKGHLNLKNGKKKKDEKGELLLSLNQKVSCVPAS